MSKTKSKDFSIGVFQGRLTPRAGRFIQFFPFENWRGEFPLAADIGLNEIEFIFDRERFEENPLWHQQGVKEINDIKRETGINVRHICADYFMAQPFFRIDDEARKEAIAVLGRLIEQAAEIGAQTIEIPLVDNSSVKTAEEEDLLADALLSVLPKAESSKIILGLETDLPPDRFLALLKRFDHQNIRANYDTGNSASLGYDHAEEIAVLSPYIQNIHIKDRVRGGATVPLGEGSADFDAFFDALRKTGYRGGFILQAARGEDGDERQTVSRYIDFLRALMAKHLAHHE